jgi:hypothetical protein
MKWLTGKDKELMSFFPVNEKYRMTAGLKEL